MTLRTDRTGDDTEPPGLIPDVADDLADMLRRGRTVGGEAVAKVVFQLADGRRVSAELPAPRPGDPALRRVDEDARKKLSQTARDILEVLEDRNGEWVPLSEVAAAMPGQPDHTSGTFTRATTELRKSGLVDSSKQQGYRLRKASD